MSFPGDTGTGLTGTLTRLWHLGRRPLTSRRRPYMAFNRMRPSRSDLLVRPGSALLIEGPMRSGNTYAVAAFRVTNGTAHHIGRHLHAPAHVIEALRLAVPPLVLLRDPVDTCVSHVIRRPALRLEDSLIDYIRFFGALEKVRRSLVVVPFEVLIVDFGAALSAVNRRFGTAFRPYVPTPENERRVTRMVEDMHRAESGGSGRIDESRVPRPSEWRREAREALMHRIESPRLRPLADEAHAVRASWLEDPATVQSHRQGRP